MKPVLVLVFFWSSVLTLPAQQADTTYYSVVKTGTVAGEQKVWHTGPTAIHYSYHYQDRGRGDSIHASVRTNPEGMILYLKATGVDYNKNAYSETFEVVNDSAITTINGIRKTSKFSNQWYESWVTPGIIAMRVNWLLRQPGKKGVTLDGNPIRTEHPVETSVSLNGKTAALSLFALYDNDDDPPHYAWFTRDTTFFAHLGLFSLIQKGYETWTDTLIALQEQAGRSYYTRQIKEQSAGIPRRLVIEHANLFESATATVKKDMTVVITEGKIAAIYPSSEKKPIQPDSVIDAKGKFLMPGLWDMHLHYESEKSEGGWYLAGGVTHGRDLGHVKILLSYRDQIASNHLLGPDISYVAGLIDKQGPLQAPGGIIVASLPDAIKAIHTYKQLGYRQIKLYSSIDPAWVAPMCAEAHKLGMRVSGHVPAFMTAEQAVNDGYDELTHLNFLFLNFLGDTLDTRTPVRFSAVGDRAGTIDLQSPEVQRFIRLLAAKKIVVDATLNLYAKRFNEFKGDTSSMLKPVVNWLPEYMRNDLAIANPYGSDTRKPAYRASFQNMLRMLKLLYDNQVELVAGTDGGRALALQYELELYVQAGIPANEVLKIATYNAAKTCGLLNSYGEIRTGLMADCILIDGNPAQNISDIRRVEWVIKNNKFYHPKQLLSLRGWKYYY
ncbi:amidohydrolase family protein [Flavihumibacter petaseus]|uniref:Amidohydrolase-related domain-containing protein n=1 Tax=Flavihumibacter petaseus NBRC 106054 TaxID=1220578 RepID=A0A0E9MV02_9BACT|nr:amidohydrolase family protein [Flavihumibacter petaseus]GAO41389.1 hypothetical protein FPE01S_01_04010 [Flavihumibacter petaseus NBRC 106054]